jgi:hypothetical protein
MSLTYPCFQAGYTFTAASSGLTLLYDATPPSHDLTWAIGEHFNSAQDLVVDINAAIVTAFGSAAIIAAIGMTGRLTFYVATGHTYALTWNDTTLRDHLGWTGNVAGVRSATGTNQISGCWYPGYRTAVQGLSPITARLPGHRSRTSSATLSLCTRAASPWETREIRCEVKTDGSGDYSDLDDLVDFVHSVADGETWTYHPDMANLGTNSLTFRLSREWSGELAFTAPLDPDDRWWETTIQVEVAT